jgi:FkbM family methyltransferase
MGRDVVRRLIRMARPSPGAGLERLARRLVSRRVTRRWVNFAYNTLTLAGKEAFYSRFAKMFREHPQHVAGGEWWIRIGERWVALPLGGHDTWLEWDLAVSMLGHEVEVKRTYLNLLSVRPPKLFLDVGANYGLHSAFFLLHGVPTVSFEPNPRCHEYFRKFAGRNALPCDIRQVALGAAEGWTEISFPERETWLGSIDPALVDQLIKAHGPVTRIRVPQMTLDAFTLHDGRRPDLIKIDTEGHEAAIVQGARNTLVTSRPWVIFESWQDTRRMNLVTLFEELDYRICALPLELPRAPRMLDQTRLLEWPGTNLIALPTKDIGLLSKRSVSQDSSPSSG